MNDADQSLQSRIVDTLLQNGGFMSYTDLAKSVGFWTTSQIAVFNTLKAYMWVLEADEGYYLTQVGRQCAHIQRVKDAFKARRRALKADDTLTVTPRNKALKALREEYRAALFKLLVGTSVNESTLPATRP